MSRDGRARVLAVVANIKQFRVLFYQELAAQLATQGITLRVAYSEPDRTEALKADSAQLSPPLGLKVPCSYLFGGRLLLQWVPMRELARADLIIVVQSNGYLLDYPLLLASRLGLKRVALWGHGYNHQADVADWRETFRRVILRQSDWWFAYTEQTARYLEAAGVPRRTITVINNAVEGAGTARSVRKMAAFVAADLLVIYKSK